MVYLSKKVIFHGYVTNNQRVTHQQRYFQSPNWDVVVAFVRRKRRRTAPLGAAAFDHSRYCQGHGAQTTCWGKVTGDRAGGISLGFT
jgi:hypothetical protein